MIEIDDCKVDARAVQWLAAIIESSDDAIISKDLDGIIRSWNPGATRLFGYSDEEAIGRPVTILIPPERYDEEPQILAKLRRGERIDHYETVRRHKNGSLVDISLTVSPIRDSDGKIIGASKIARNISERKRAEERQLLLLREMSHRVKNVFALASAMVTLSATSATTVKGLARAVHDRLEALGRAHDLTLPDLAVGERKSNRVANLSDLVQTVFAPYAATGANAPNGGPSVSVHGRAVTGLALVLHEMATNAAKYGALSSPNGHVDICWSVRKGELVLIWREIGGPPLSGEPLREGFGTFISQLIVTSQFSGSLSRDWNKDGLTIKMTVPLESLER